VAIVTVVEYGGEEKKSAREKDVLIKNGLQEGALETVEGREDVLYPMEDIRNGATNLKTKQCQAGEDP
jgi:hypothetical protein